MNNEPSTDIASTNLGALNRYAQLELAEDTVIIYDREQTNGWIQSDTTVSTEITIGESTASEVERHYERQLAAMYAERPITGGDTDG
ncbi:hypothetical protein ACFFQF_20590 [Haladaptatus pallidirubidus]|uniref:Uncharacterized protein n=1 Tax=Haladaptatus pallidirubidus TaxID=1008152 RepID=A0AAV3UQG9_9EURY|nr:hypothetical protein [Haladaptatus pallidirubidus]